MSLPESEKELLLSASIDGALSPEEQEMLENWFRQDPTAELRRAELTGLVDSIREACRPLRHGSGARQSLGADFANAIVDRAVAEAMADKLPASHPLVRIGQAQPQAFDRATPSPVVSTWLWRRAAAVAALAAAVSGVVFLANRPAGDGDFGGGSLVQDTPRELPVRPESPLNPSEAIDRIAIAPNAVPAQGPIQPASPMADESNLASPAPADIAIAPVPAGQPLTTSRPAPGVTESLPPAETPTMPSADDSLALAAVMVVSVELTDAGRESLALLAALRAADIRIGNNGIVSDQVVSGLSQSAVVQPPTGDQAAKLYFVEAPARQIDRFLMQVMSDKESFASIGLGIADNPPLLAAIGRWRPGEAERDASQNPVGQPLAAESRPASVARDLVGADGTPLNIGRGAAVIPLDRNQGSAALMMAAPAAASQPGTAKDFSAQLLLLVH